MVLNLKKFISVLLCAGLLWTSGEFAHAASCLFVPAVSSNHSTPFTNQALVEPLITPHRVSPRLSPARLLRSLGELNKPFVVSGILAFGLSAFRFPDSPNALGLSVVLYGICFSAIEAAIRVLAGGSLVFDFSRLACGVVMIIGSSTHWTLKQILAIGYRAVEILDIRGRQSGGWVTYFRNGMDIHARVKNPKRGELAANMNRVFYLNWMAKKIVELARGTVLEEPEAWVFHGQVRLATASMATRREAHPLRWLSIRRRRFWSVQGNRLVGMKRWVTNTISHNGDFDDIDELWQSLTREQQERVENSPVVRLHDQVLSQREAGAWLNRVFHTNNTLKGDSPKIAGFIDLFHTQGQWDASARLAWLLAVCRSPNDMPLTEKQVSLLGDLLERAFVPIAGQIIPTGGAYLSEATPEARARLQRALIARLRDTPEWADLLGDHLRDFAQAAVTSFLDNDLCTATHDFMQRAIGSFGLGVSSSLAPGKGIMVSRKQSMAVGVSADRTLIGAASDDTVLKQKGFDFMVALDSRGELADIVVKDGVAFIDVYPEREVKSPAEYGQPMIPIPEEEVQGRVVDLTNPLVEPLPAKTHRNPVDQDIFDMPLVAQKVRDSWDRTKPHELDDPEGFNLQAAQDFSTLHIAMELRKAVLRHVAINDQGPELMKWLQPHAYELALKARAGTMSTEELEAAVSDLKRDAQHWVEENSGKTQGATEEARPIDVLVLGYENGLWLGEQFLQDYEKLFANTRLLVLKPESSNKVLRALKDQQRRQDFQLHVPGGIINRQTIVLVISQSGQTFPSVNAAIQSMEKLDIVENDQVFGLTGQLHTPLGEVLGQKYMLGSPFTRRIFTNKSGWRPAEPSSVAAMATHLTLTELLIYLAEDYRRVFRGNLNPLGIRLGTEQIDELKRRRDKNIDVDIPLLVGHDAAGHPVASDIHQAIDRETTRWAWHVWDIWFGTGVLASYILATVAFHVKTAAQVIHLHGYAAGLFDTFVYIFAAPMAIWLLRFFTGRPVLVRLAPRKLFIADIPHVVQVLEMYFTKLFSLAYKGLGLLAIHAGNPRDHFTARFSQRANRGDLILLGLPDREMNFLRNEHSSSVLSVKQFYGNVSMWNTVETVSIGRNGGKEALFQNHLSIPRHSEERAGSPMAESSALQVLNETRFDALARMVAGFVFGQMWVRKVTLGGRLWQYWRTQGGAKVFSTASPETAAKTMAWDWIVSRGYLSEPWAERLAFVEEFIFAGFLLALPLAFMSPSIADLWRLPLIAGNALLFGVLHREDRVRNVLLGILFHVAFFWPSASALTTIGTSLGIHFLFNGIFGYRNADADDSIVVPLAQIPSANDFHVRSLKRPTPAASKREEPLYMPGAPESTLNRTLRSLPYWIAGPLIVIALIIASLFRGSQKNEPELVSPEPREREAPPATGMPQPPEPKQPVRVHRRHVPVRLHVPSGPVPFEEVPTPDSIPVPFVHHVGMAVEPDYVGDRPAVTLTWKQMTDAVVSAAEADAALQAAADDTAAQRAAKEAHPFATIAASGVMETGNAYGIGPAIVKTISLTHDPLRSLQAATDQTAASLAKNMRTLDLQQKLATLSAARDALLAAENAGDESGAEAAHQQIEELVLPVLHDAPAHAHIAIVLEEGEPFAIANPQAALQAEASAAALHLAQALEQAHGDAKLHFLSTMRKILPTGLVINANPIVWGTFGSLGFVTPQFTRYHPDWAAESKKIQAALETYQTAVQTSVTHFGGTFITTHILDVYQQAYGLETQPVLDAVQNYLETQQRRHPHDASLGDVAGALEIVPAAVTAAPALAPSESITAYAEPDAGNVSSSPHIKWLAPVYAATPGLTSASPAATTIENKTGTVSAPVLTLTQLVNGSRMNHRKKEWAEAVEDARAAEREGVKRTVLMARYRVALAASKLTYKDRHDVAVALSAQRSPHYYYYVATLTQGHWSLLRSVTWKLLGRPSQPLWTPELAKATLEAKLAVRSAPDDDALRTLYSDLQAITEDENSSYLVPLAEAWGTPLAENAPDELVRAQLELTLIKENRPSKTAAFIATVTPVWTRTKPGTDNRGQTATLTAAFSVWKKIKSDYRAQVDAAQFKVHDEEAKAAHATYQADIARQSIQSRLSAYTTLQNEFSANPAAHQAVTLIATAREALLEHASKQHVVLDQKADLRRFSRMVAADPSAVAHAVADAEVPTSVDVPSSFGKKIKAFVGRNVQQDVSASAFHQYGYNGFYAGLTNYVIGPGGLGKARKKEAVAAANLAAGKAARAKRQAIVDVIGLFNRQAALYAQVLRDENRYEAALEDLREAYAERGPDSPDLLDSLERVLVVLDSVHQSEEDFTEADYQLRQRIVAPAKAAHLPLTETPMPDLAAPALREKPLSNNETPANPLLGVESLLASLAFGGVPSFRSLRIRRVGVISPDDVREPDVTSEEVNAVYAKLYQLLTEDYQSYQAYLAFKEFTAGEVEMNDYLSNDTPIGLQEYLFPGGTHRHPIVQIIKDVPNAREFAAALNKPIPVSPIKRVVAAGSPRRFLWSSIAALFFLSTILTTDPRDVLAAFPLPAPAPVVVKAPPVVVKAPPFVASPQPLKKPAEMKFAVVDVEDVHGKIGENLEIWKNVASGAAGQAVSDVLVVSGNLPRRGSEIDYVEIAQAILMRMKMAKQSPTPSAADLEKNIQKFNAILENTGKPTHIFVTLTDALRNAFKKSPSIPRRAPNRRSLRQSA